MRKYFHPNTQKTSTLLISVALLCFAVFGVHGYSSRQTHTEEVLEKVLRSLEAMVGFFSRDYSYVNVDGLFGIRVGQGSINQSLADCSTPDLHCPQILVSRLENLNTRIERIARNAMPYVEAQDPDYFTHFQPTLDGPYILQYDTEVITDIPPKPEGNRNYDEEQGDLCISSMMGRYENEPKCTIPDECMQMMTHEDTAGYVITHQLLYFIVGDKTGCVPQLSSKLKALGEKSLRSHERELCAHILGEAMQEAKKGNVAVLDQDLFLEQCTLCGILGFQNFMTEDWVQMILSWQSEDGCFALPTTLLGVEDEILKLRVEERRLLRLMKKEAENIERAPATGRKLLREQLMEGDCLAHKTGLGFGMVSAYIRHFIRVLYGSPRLQ